MKRRKNYELLTYLYINISTVVHLYITYLRKLYTLVVILKV